MKPGPANHVRIARPSHDLRASERFWVGGLGLEVLLRIDEPADGGHALVMVGGPGAAWHLELVRDPDDVTPAAPTEEDQLVLYLGGEVDEDVIRRLVDSGGTRVAAPQPVLGPVGSHDRWPGRVPARPVRPVLALTQAQACRVQRRGTCAMPAACSAKADLASRRLARAPGR